MPVFSALRLLTSQAGPASGNQARGCREKNVPGFAADRHPSGAKDPERGGGECATLWGGGPSGRATHF